MDMPNLQSTSIEVDLAELLRTCSEFRLEFTDRLISLAEEANKQKYIGQTVGYMSRQIAELEQVQAANLGALQARLLDQYEYSADRRFKSRAFLRFLSLGLTGRKDADDASTAAYQEMERLGKAMEQMTARQMITAVLSRLELLKVLTGSSHGGIDLALRLLERVLPPEEYRQLLEVASRATDEAGE